MRTCAAVEHLKNTRFCSSYDQILVHQVKFGTTGWGSGQEDTQQLPGSCHPHGHAPFQSSRQQECVIKGPVQVADGSLMLLQNLSGQQGFMCCLLTIHHAGATQGKEYAVRLAGIAHQRPMHMFCVESISGSIV